MKTLLIARKSMIEMLREPQLLMLVLALPLLFLGITATTYGGALLVTHPVLIVDPPDAGVALIEYLRGQTYADGRPAFEITVVDASYDVNTALGEKVATAALILSEAKPDRLDITLHGDALSMRYYQASTLLNRAVREYADRIAGRRVVVQIATKPMGKGAPQTELDVYAPGMIIFGLLLIAPQTAMLIARETRWGTLRRLRLTRVNAWHLLAGTSLAQMIVAVGQVILVFVAAILMGFHNQGSLALAILVGLTISFSSIGQGLVVACFAENDSQAANVGSTIAMLQVFLSGAFYQLPAITLFRLAGHQIDLFDIFPARHGMIALQQLLTHGASFREIAFRLGATLLLSVAFMAAGVFTFRKLKMEATT